MKTKFIKSTLFLAIAAGLVTSCVNDDDYSTPPLDCIETTLVKNKEVATVPATAVATQYQLDDVIEAYVTSSDEAGNFFKSISFQTLQNGATAPIGFSVPVDATSTFVSYEPGRKVLIKLKNQYTDISNGSMRIGSIFVSTSGAAQVGRIPTPDVKRVLNASCTKINEDDLVRTLTIAQAKQDANINTLIELDMVQFSDAAITTTYYTSAQDLGGATNHLLNDANGNTVIFRTSSFANFAGHPVASGRGKVRGVMTKFGTDYQFVARTERDIQLTNPRLVPFFVEDFQTAVDNTNLNIPNWTNVATVGTRVWREEAFSGNGYAEFSAFGSGNAVNEAWLVSPPVNMDTHTGELLTFRTAQHHLDVDSPGNSLKVYVSTNFTGNPATATWTEVSVNLPVQATAWYEFVSSGAVDLSSYTGNVHVGFKFTGSGTNLTLDGAFQVDDFKVYGN